jgi:aminopeptidase N
VTQELFAKKKASDPAIADAAVALAAADGDTAMYDALMRVAGDTQNPDVAAAALTALARFEDPALVKRTLAYAISGGVRGQDSWALIAQLLRQRATQRQAWEFVTGSWQQILDKGSVLSGTRIVEATGSFCTVRERHEVADFFATHEVESSQRALKISLGEIDACIGLRTAQEPNLRRWLDGRSGPVLR